MNMNTLYVLATDEVIDATYDGLEDWVQRVTADWSDLDVVSVAEFQLNQHGMTQFPGRAQYTNAMPYKDGGYTGLTTIR